MIRTLRARLAVLGFATVALTILSIAPASAGPIVIAGDTVKFGDGPGTTGGGEFMLTVDNTWSFITFCLQRTEYVDFSHVFTVDAVSPYTISDPAANGGDAQGRDYISPQTAFLYTLFTDGTLPNYDYNGAGHTASANLLQRAFWMLEQELPMDASNYYVALANNAVSSGAWSGIGDVRVLNLSLNGIESQDQLTRSTVPEPTTLVLVGIAGAARLVARRRRV